MRFARFVSSLMWVLAISVATTTHAAAQEEPRESVVPTRMCGEYFLIPLEVDLDNDGETTTLMAIFDTGGAGLHIDPDAVVRAGGAPVEERKRITIRGATAGPLTFNKLRPYTLQLDHLSRPLGTEIDVFLPYRAFKEYLLTLDFPRREMRIERGRLPAVDGVEVFGARGRDRRPYLDVDVAGKRHRLLVDSGSSGSISIQPGRELPWVSELVPASVGQGMSKLHYSDVGRLDAEIDLAGVKIIQPLVEIGSITELIGTNVMRSFAWTFDQKTRRMRIRPASPDPLRLPPRRGTGAIYLPSADGYEIAKVLEETPAQRAGLRAGDVVVAVDGTPVYEQGCDRWKEKHRTETTLTVLREGKTFDVKLEVIDIVP